MSNLRRVKESKRNGKGTADIFTFRSGIYDRLKFLQKTVIQSIFKVLFKRCEWLVNCNVSKRA